MKRINTENAIGHMLCHDLTQILPGVSKDARFRKGHIVTAEDIPVLLSMGKRQLFVWEVNDSVLHENEAAAILADLCQGENMRRGEVKEGKIEIFAETDGLFCVDVPRLNAVNETPELMIATRHTNTPVKAGESLCGTRIIPLLIDRRKMEDVRDEFSGAPLLSLLPYRLNTAAVITTGSEVFSGLVRDAFTPVVEEKLRCYGIRTVYHEMTDDADEHILAAIGRSREKKPELILVTGGMSVDPDDRTPAAIRNSGARIVTYGAPVLPGAMFLLGYFSDAVPIAGLPGCVMYAKTTVFDLLLPRLAAGVPITRKDVTALGCGGLCLGCSPCTWPNCGFGK